LRNSSYHRVDLYDNLGIAYGMKGDLSKAKEVLLEGIQYNPRSAKLYLNLAITCRNMGENELAETYFDTAFKLDPSLEEN
jgi:Tfp pilus assembly protein PilF